MSSTLTCLSFYIGHMVDGITWVDFHPWLSGQNSTGNLMCSWYIIKVIVPTIGLDSHVKIQPIWVLQWISEMYNDCQSEAQWSSSVPYNDSPVQLTVIQTFFTLFCSVHWFLACTYLPNYSHDQMEWHFKFIFMSDDATQNRNDLLCGWVASCPSHSPGPSPAYNHGQLQNQPWQEARKLCTLNLWDHGWEIEDICFAMMILHPSLYHWWQIFAEYGSITCPQTSIIGPKCIVNWAILTAIQDIYKEDSDLYFVFYLQPTTK